MLLNKILNTSIKKSLLRNLSAGNGLRYLSGVSVDKFDHLDFYDEKLQKYLEFLRKEFYNLRANASSNRDYRRIAQLSDVVKALEQHRVVKGNMISKEEVAAEKDDDMKELMEEENKVYGELLKKTEAELLNQMYLMADGENYDSVIFEITAGAGGQEAMLFAKELFNMYTNYFEKHGWDYEILIEDLTDIGGLRHANVTINDAEAFRRLRYEAGVHRVQRVPTTEKYGRVHTSTASVAVIPRPADIAIRLLENELKIETKRSSGAGGQHVNTTDSAVRIVHLPSGVAVESQSERSQIKNKEIALKRLQSKLIQIEMESADASVKGTRKAQLGNLERNEKIRTYNFSQDRITDHRIRNGTVYNLKEFLQGGENLHSLIEKLAIENRRKNLQEMIDNFQDSITELVNKEKKRGSEATVKVGPPETSSKCDTSIKGTLFLLNEAVQAITNSFKQIPASTKARVAAFKATA
uniref:Prokaryotic-type class I peptide chain release factors domain-containing protein n=1 Tax=Glossina austeni TaxID=7395 RepID=A0A1A9UV03_GLOAU